MSKPASKKVIGFFVIGAIALAVVVVLAFGSGKLFKKTFKAVCYFEGSVGGLSIGAPVVFRGVKIGTVTEILLRYDPEKVVAIIPVFIEIEQQVKREAISQEQRREGWKRLIDAGLRARLDMQSIVTGQLQVGFDIYSDKPAKFIGADPGYLEIPTIPTPFQELAKKVEKIPIDEIFQKVLSAVEGIEKVVNSPEITATVRSVNQAADEAKGLIHDVRGEVKPLAASLQDTVKEVGELAQNVNAQVEPLSSNLAKTVEEVRKLAKDTDAQISELGPALKEAVGDLRGVVKNVDGQVGSIASSAKGAIEEYGKLARDIDARIPAIASGLEKNLDELQRTLVQAREALALLGDSFNENASLYLETTRTLEELSAGARSIRLLADYLKRHPESVLWGKGKSGGE